MHRIPRGKTRCVAVREKVKDTALRTTQTRAVEATSLCLWKGSLLLFFSLYVQLHTAPMYLLEDVGCARRKRRPWRTVR